MIGRMMTLALSAALAATAAWAETVEVPGGQLHYETCGSGAQAIMLIHDGVIDAAGFDDLWPILCRDFRVVRYDRRGYGQSPASKTPYTAQDDLTAVLAAAKLEHVSLVGFSFGGGLALNYAIEHPQVVDRLVLSGASISGFAVTKHFTDRNMKIALPMLIGNFDGVVANAAKDPYLLAPGHDAARQKAIALSKASPQNFRHQMRDPLKAWPSDLPKMPAMTTPTLILVGEHDIPDVQAMAGAAQALIPGARRVVVNDTGHLMQLERPREVADLIADFVRQKR